MRDLTFEICGQVDDVNGRERTFSYTDTTTDTQCFRDEGDLRLWRNFDTELPGPDDGARLFALLSTLLWLTSIRIHDGYTGRN